MSTLTDLTIHRTVLLILYQAHGAVNVPRPLWGPFAVYRAMWAFLFAGLPRYHFPLIPIFAVLGAIGLVAFWEIWQPADRRTGRVSVATGRLGAKMSVEIHNDGPVTITLHSREL